MFGLPDSIADKLADTFGQAILHAVRPIAEQVAEIKSRLAVLAPPPNAIPIAWSCADDVPAGDPQHEWGVHWEPALDTSNVNNAPSNAHIVNTDAAGPGAPFPFGWRGLAWVDVYVSQVASNAVMHAPRQCRWSLRHRGAQVPGYTRQFAFGDARRIQTGGALLDIENGAGAMTHPQMRIPIQLRPGDSLSVLFDAEDLGAGTASYIAHVRGWRWQDMNLA